MQFKNKKPLRNTVDKVIETSLITIMILMVINVLWQVFSRYFLTQPSSFTDELSRYLMIWLGILGAAYVSGRNMHVAIDVLPSRSNDKTQKKLKSIIQLIIVAFSFFALVIGGSRLVYITYTLNQFSPALHAPLALIYFVIPTSGILIIYYKISDFLKK
ncbi:TRAP transporter small permease [Wenyingzhuangia sp. 2_MG-2023]|uniref:TRAP transporter small permease n=1 Tax=Wenyingzhuangia sp. 2_MG-2023 TaxID=3062639 RepID=UPI0026E2D272|nr:TRAP transporter small permease [Wenyingzhuangia sp. 2_MG-2023]MDO6738800.1 TRAP transporter small permease [Wenyingzhuangia sp. 2_MG-2023]MDO6802348.1 TRAP transporter small permease [Wenyingzhuangia sp. 1_MG-2023]